MTATTTAEPVLVFDVHICAERRSYVATFTGPDAAAHAIAFLRPKGATHAYTLCDETDEERAGADAAMTDELSEFLWPSCEHGLSLWLCAGPGHYPADR